MTLDINYPHKPYVITQKWGNPNSAYATYFGDPNFLLHNGIDSSIGSTLRVDHEGKPITEYPVYCPVENFIVERVQYVEKGGGHEIWLKSLGEYSMFDKKCYARIILCHAKKILVPEGHKPRLGELIMIADSTGFSTGLHTHMGLYRINKKGVKIDTNKATGSFNPGFFFTGRYAVDEASIATLVLSGLRYYKAYLLGK